MNIKHQQRLTWCAARWDPHPPWPGRGFNLATQHTILVNTHELTLNPALQITADELPLTSETVTALHTKLLPRKSFSSLPRLACVLSALSYLLWIR